MVGHAPPQLFRYFVAQRLAAFRVIGAHVDVDERPIVVVVVRQLAAQAVDLIVGAVHSHQRRPVDGRADNLAALQVGGNEHHCPHTGPGGMRSDTAGQVAGGGAGNRLETELYGLGGRHRNHAVFERERRVDAVVLDIQIVQAQPLTQVVSLEQRRKPRHDIHTVFAVGGQQVGVAPDAQGPGGDAVPADHLGDSGVVVDHFQRAETEFADIQGIGGLFAPALAAFESSNESHCPWFLLSGRKPE